MRQASLLAVIPIIMVAAPLVGYFIGSLLDRWLGTEPWLVVVFIILGFVASGKEIYNILRRVNKDT
jgi:ATP synthase protein I